MNRLYDGELCYCRTCNTCAYLDKAAMERLDSVIGRRLPALDVLHPCCKSPQHYWIVESDIVDISSLVPMDWTQEQWGKWATELRHRPTAPIAETVV